MSKAESKLNDIQVGNDQYGYPSFERKDLINLIEELCFLAFEAGEDYGIFNAVSSRCFTKDSPPNKQQFLDSLFKEEIK